MLECIFEVENLQKTPEENLNNIKQIIGQVYEAVNAPDAASAIPTADFIKRKVFKMIGKNLASNTKTDEGIYKVVDKVFYGNKTKLCIP